MEIRGPSQGYGRPIRTRTKGAVQGSCPGTRSPVLHSNRGQGGMRRFADTADLCGSMRPPVRTKEIGTMSEREYQATWAPRGRTVGEFYSGIRPGDRVRVRVDEYGTHKSYSVQSLLRPGAWLAVQREDLVP